MTMDLQKDSCAIVVTFKPDITALLKLLGQLNKETEFVVIDNGSADIKKLMESTTLFLDFSIRMDHYKVMNL